MKGVSFDPNWLGKTLLRRWDPGQALRRGKLRFDRAEWKLRSISSRRKGIRAGSEVGMMIAHAGHRGSGLAVNGHWVVGGSRTGWTCAGCSSAEATPRGRRADGEEIRLGQHAGLGWEKKQSQCRRGTVSGLREKEGDPGEHRCRSGKEGVVTRLPSVGTNLLLDDTSGCGHL